MDSRSNASSRHLGVYGNSAAESGAATIQEQQAVILGIDIYRAGIKPLRNASADARALADLLTMDFGFAFGDLRGPLLDEGASLSAMSSAVQASLAAAHPMTRWLFYYSGHGLVVDRQGYLLPHDAVLGDVRTYFSIQRLLEQCVTSACGEVLVILDACYGGQALVRSDQLSDYIPGESPATKVRQLITSGNPDQPVLDGGGEGHSVFTQTLLEALQGWAGIHDADGSVRFSKLLDHLVFEVPARLRSLGLPAGQQQPVGGNLVGNRLRRDFVFQCRAPRLSPETLLGARSEDPLRRRQDLARLVDLCRLTPQLTPLAVKVAALHLRRASVSDRTMLVTSTLRHEPVAEVRAAAAEVLGALGASSAVQVLVEALDDTPIVCRAASRALGQLGAGEAAVPLLRRLQASDDDVFLDLIDALAAIGNPETLVSALREAKRLGRLIPVVGPDLPKELTGLPDRATVAQRLAERENVPKSNSLAETAAATMRGTNSRYAFTSFMKRELDDQLAKPGPVHQALAALKFPFCISGAYDDLLVRAMNANRIVSGKDTQYVRSDRPTVLQLMGNLATLNGLVILPEDYELLRENEEDRALLLGYLRRQLQGSIVLFLGHDPHSSDFALMVDRVLNKHLAEVDSRAVLVWPEPGPHHRWGGHILRSITHDPLDLLGVLSLS